MANPWDNDPVVGAPSLGQFGSGNIDLTNRPRVKNEDGSISTVRSMSANFDGQEVLLPTVSDDGRIMSDDEAIDQYLKTGKYLGKFNTVDEANAYADRLHGEQEQMYASGGMPWDSDPVVEDDGQGFGGQPLNIDIVGGQRVGNTGVTYDERQRETAEQDKYLQSLRDQTAQIDSDYAPIRELALGGRAMLRGIASIPDVVAAPLAAGLNKILPEGYRQSNFTETADYLADLAGAPRPETPQERISGDVIGAVSSLPIGFGVASLGRAAANPTVAGIAETALQNQGTQLAATAAGSTASSATREAGGGTGAQIAAGLVGGVAPSVARAAVPAVAGAVLSSTVPEVRRDLARQALARGIELTPAQLSDSRFVRFTQSALRSVPFTGAARRSERQVAQFNRAVANAIGENADNVDAQVNEAARRRQSNLFGQLTARNALNVDTRFLRSLQNISDNSSVSPQARQAVDAAIERLYDQATTGPNGVVIPGRSYQALDSDLGNIVRAGGVEGHYVGQLRDAIRGAMDRSISPQDAQAWRQLRREYANRKTIEPLVAKSGGEGIPPAQVLSAATNTKSSKTAMATGRGGEIGTLGNIGRLMREPPSSGTAERASVTSLFTLGGYANPVLGALSYTAAQLAARGLDSRTIARMMIQQNPGLSMADAERIAAQAVLPATASTSTVE